MATSNAVAVWEGKLRDGKGSFKAQSGVFSGSFSFGTRFEGKKGSNPEELLAAAPRVASPRQGQRLYAGAPSGLACVSGSRVRSGQCTEARGRHPASLPRRKVGTVQRKDVTLGVVAILVAAVCVLLGRWQLNRLAQRRARNSVLAARLALPPLSVRRDVTADSARQRRVVAQGVYDFSVERTWPGRSFQGTPGV